MIKPTCAFPSCDKFISHNSRYGYCNFSHKREHLLTIYNDIQFSDVSFESFMEGCHIKTNKYDILVAKNKLLEQKVQCLDNLNSSMFGYFKNDYYRKILMDYACDNNDENLIKYILDNSPDSSIYNLNLINYCLEFNHLPLLKTLSKSFPNTIVYSASQYGHLNIVKYLISLGYELSKDSILCAAYNNHIDLVKYYFSFENNLQYLNEALVKSVSDFIFSNSSKSLDTFKYLLSIDADISYNDYKCLRYICKDAESFKYVLSLDIIPKDIIQKRCSDFIYDLDILKLFISHGFSFDPTEFLREFVKYKLNNKKDHFPLIKFLIQNGADIYFDNYYLFNKLCAFYHYNTCYRLLKKYNCPYEKLSDDFLKYYYYRKHFDSCILEISMNPNLDYYRSKLLEDEEAIKNNFYNFSSDVLLSIQ